VIYKVDIPARPGDGVVTSVDRETSLSDAA
jgi:hypothetical protein